MKKKKKISLIIPMYNVEEYLEECLDSVVNQDFGIENVEVVLIDDCSKDMTNKIAREYADKYGFTLIINEKNSGLAISRNKGIKYASSDYIVFLDSDDLLPSNALSILYENVTVNNADMAIARLKAFDSKGEYGYYTDKYIKSNEVTNIYKKHDLINCMSVCSKIYKSEKVKNTEFIPKTYHEDNFFTIVQLFSASIIVTIPDYLYLRRYREGENKSIMQCLDYKTFNDLILNFRRALTTIKSTQNINFLYYCMIRKLNNYRVTKLNKEDRKRAKKDIKLFISDMKLNSVQKNRIKIFNTLYCFSVSVYGKIKNIVKKN